MQLKHGLVVDMVVCLDGQCTGNQPDVVKIFISIADLSVKSITSFSLILALKLMHTELV